MSTSSETEYAALRATIRERGTARMVLSWVSIALWAVLAIVSYPPSPFTCLIQLLVLAAGFEVVSALHLNVERIGRYLQVFHETPGIGAGSWEHTSMAFGRAYPGTGSDPLFGFVYAMAVLLNMAPAVVTRPDAIASGILTAAHVLMLGKIVVARERAGRQRAEDLQRFEALQRQETERPPADHSPELAASRQD